MPKNIINLNSMGWDIVIKMTYVLTDNLLVSAFWILVILLFSESFSSGIHSFQEAVDAGLLGAAD